MATTPNFSWPTPDNTDLVRNGALAIRNLGDAIDGTVAGIDQATTKGDLLVYDGTDYQRLPVGANDEVLVADSLEATGVKWDAIAGGSFTLLASGTFSGASVNLTGIPGGFKELMVRAVGVTSVAGSGCFIRLNGSSASVYQGAEIRPTATSVFTYAGNTANTVTTQTAATTPQTNWVFRVQQYDQITTTTGRVPFKFEAWDRGNNATKFAFGTANLDTITEINFVQNTSTFNGGTYELYGVN